MESHQAGTARVKPRSRLAAIAGAVLIAAGALGAYAYATRWSDAARQRAAVRALLTDPESAVFRGEFAGARVLYRPVVWCGEVNARNRMGGMAGFTRYVVMFRKDETWLERFFFLPIDVMVDSGDPQFATRWETVCIN